MRYLFITFSRKPNGQIDEAVSMGKRVRDSDLTSCNVILDFAERKIVKCIIEGKEHISDFASLRNYYYKVYPKLILQLEKESAITAEQDTINKNKQ
jgi:predicted ester cyclase